MSEPSDPCAALANLEPFLGLLLAVHREARTGVLEVDGEGAHTVVYVHQGTPVFAEEGTLGESLGRVLLRDGQLTSDQYTRVLELMTGSMMDSEQLRFGEVAIKLGYLTEEQVTLALREQVRLKVLRCLQWESPECGFRPAADEVREVGHYPCPMHALLMAGIRRFFHAARSERLWRTHAHERPRLRRPAATVAQDYLMQPSERAWLGLLDGSTPVSVLLARAGEDSLRYGRVICALMAADDLVWESSPSGPEIERSRRGKPVRTPPPPAPDRTPGQAGFPPPDAPVVAGAVVVEAIDADADHDRSAGQARQPKAPDRNDGIAHEGRVSPEAHPQAPKELGPPATAVIGRIKPARVMSPAREERLRAEQHFQRGKRHLGAGEFAQASGAFFEAARLFPAAIDYLLHAEWASFQTLTRPGEKLIKRKDLRGLALQVVRQNRSTPFAHYVLGELALLDGDRESAITAFRLAVKLDPHDAQYRRAYESLTTERE